MNQIDTSNHKANDGTVEFELTPTIISGVKGIECYVSDEEMTDENNTPIRPHNKKYKTSIDMKADNNTNEQVVEDDNSASEDNEELEFIAALKEFENADPALLKAFIEQADNSAMDMV